ncbi:MAG: hypothetical protein PVF68_10005 [Acidobacteriota bacterium]|jgi:hypothetical protein
MTGAGRPSAAHRGTPARGERGFAIAVTLAYALVAAFGMVHHEPWRDELQAWMVVTDADSLAGVYGNMRYEGNPMLWQAFLFGLSRITDDPRIMQGFHLLIAIAFVWVFSRYAPFTRLQRLLFPFGYFALFEYGLISRNYAFGVLLLGIACALYGDRTRRYPWLGLVLLLLANTSLYGMVIVGGLTATLAVDFLSRRSEAAFAGRGPALALCLILAAVGVGLSAYQIWPEPDNTFFVPYPETPFDPTRLAFVASKIFAAYVPIPEIASPHWWNTNAFVGEGSPLNGVLALVALGAGTLVFLGKPRVLFLYLATNGILLFLFYLTLLSSARYYGHFFLLLLACAWIARGEPSHRYRRPGLERLAETGRLAAGRFLTFVLAANLLGGATAYGKDLREPFTVTGEVAAWVRASPWADLPAVAATDFQTSPLSALLRRKLYYPEQRELGSFLVWDRDRKDLIDLDDVAAAVRAVARPGERALLILSFPPEAIRDGRRQRILRGNLAPDIRIRHLRSFPPGVVADETYHLYIAERDPAPAG